MKEIEQKKISSLFTKASGSLIRKNSVNETGTSICTVKSDSPFYAGFSYIGHDFPYNHIHTHWEIVVVLSGELIHVVNGETRIMRRGDACILRPNDSHILTFHPSSTKNQRIDLFFSCDLCKSLLAPYCSYDKLMARKDHLYFLLDGLALENFIQKTTNYSTNPTANQYITSALIVNSLLISFLDYEQNYNQSYPAWLNDFLQAMNSPQNFDKKITDLVSLTPYSHSGLQQAFKRYIGTSLVKYFNQVKMLYAKQLLLTSSRTTLEISTELGYDSLSTFNHNFKAAFNMTPSEMRRSGNETIKMTITSLE